MVFRESLWGMEEIGGFVGVREGLWAKEIARW